MSVEQESGLSPQVVLEDSSHVMGEDWGPEETPAQSQGGHADSRSVASGELVVESMGGYADIRSVTSGELALESPAGHEETRNVVSDELAVESLAGHEETRNVVSDELAVGSLAGPEETRNVVSGEPAMESLGGHEETRSVVSGELPAESLAGLEEIRNVVSDALAVESLEGLEEIRNVASGELAVESLEGREGVENYEFELEDQQAAEKNETQTLLPETGEEVLTESNMEVDHVEELIQEHEETTGDSAGGSAYPRGIRPFTAVDLRLRQNQPEVNAPIDMSNRPQEQQNEHPIDEEVLSPITEEQLNEYDWDFTDYCWGCNRPLWTHYSDGVPFFRMTYQIPHPNYVRMYEDWSRPEHRAWVFSTLSRYMTSRRRHLNPDQPGPSGLTRATSHAPRPHQDHCYNYRYDEMEPSLIPPTEFFLCIPWIFGPRSGRRSLSHRSGATRRGAARASSGGGIRDGSGSATQPQRPATHPQQPTTSKDGNSHNKAKRSDNKKKHNEEYETKQNPKNG